MKLILSLVLLLVGCKDPIFPSATPYIPPARWRELWVQVEKCSGRTGNFDRVHWFIADSLLHDERGNPLEGAWYSGTHNIYLDYRVVEENGVYAGWYQDRVVMHEMLHDLLGTADHPIEFDTCDLR